MQTFTDLVGTAAVPAHCFDIEELTELTPALDTATAAHCFDIEELTELTPALDTATAAHDTAEQASDAGPTFGVGTAECASPEE